MRRMTEADLEPVARLEQELFAAPWKKSDFVYELQQNPYANLAVIEAEDAIVAYCDWWILYEQAQIATIGVSRAHQRHGFGQQMMNEIIRDAIEKGCETVSLEVRVSNLPAIRLYEKNGFITVNIRKGYYEDNHEDAYLMVKPIGGLKNEHTDTGN